MTWIDDVALRHLRAVIDLPDLSGSRYVLHEPIGRGGMGTVYRARDTQLERDVALKVLAIPDPDESLGRRMMAEAGILARLEHPGIVPVHDAGRLPDGRAFYVMKRVHGQRLDQLDTAAISIAELVRTVRRICDPVAFAHAHGIIHRDLTPGNVMLGSFGEVLVLDWGVAKVMDDAAGRRTSGFDEPAGAGHGAAATPTTAGTGADQGAAGQAAGRIDGRTGAGDRLGTPGYMSPEQRAGEAAAVDARADVYGIGALLFFLLCGRPPAAIDEDASDDAVRHTLARRRPPLPRRLRAIIGQSLATDPARRYATAGALAADLDRFLDGQPVSAHRENIAERTAAWISKYRTAVALVLTYIVLRIAFILLRG